MKKNIANLIVCVVVLLSCTESFSQSRVLSKIPLTGVSPRLFIPAGYDTLQTAEGDLNKDGIADFAMVLQSDKERDASLDEEGIDVDSLPKRILVVLLKKNDVYQLAAKTDKAILCKYCGGIFGEPFDGIWIDKGILQLHHYGGSAWRWSYTHKFRYQQNNLYLIGETTLSYWNVENCEKLDEFAGTEYMDINYVTGQYEQKKVSAEGCKLLINKKGKKPVKPLKKLSQFSIE